MALGKARFLVKKLRDYRRSEFKVKTPTAVVGVRGSDFVVIATLTDTEVTSLEDTKLEVVNTEIPEEPKYMEDFQRTLITTGEVPTIPETITPAEAEQTIQELPALPAVEDPGAIVATAVTPTEKKQEATPAKPAESATTEEEEPAETVIPQDAEEEGEILVADDALVAPEAIDTAEDLAPAPEIEVPQVIGQSEQTENVSTISGDIQQEIKEDIIIDIESLPYFPDPPAP
ncbi:hypothetical protein ACFLZG_03955 [Thermodesulfobacteriota bacterium]